MANENELTWRLSDPGMDLLERAGLAGLYMALRAAQEANQDLSPLTWTDADLTAESVTVCWSGPAKPAFVKLMEWAWQVQDGVLYLPAVHDSKDGASIQNRVTMHSGIMRTFLQHTNVQPKGEPVTRIITLDENREVSVSFQPPIVRPPKATSEDTLPKGTGPKKLLKPWKDLDELFDRKDEFRSQLVKLSNWVYPGIAGRYGDEMKTAWEGMPVRAILLMLAPTTCFYQRLQGQGGNWIFVVPDIRDLQDFADTRRRMTLNLDFTDVASLGDAGLRFLAEYSTRNPRKKLEAGCRVVAMGRVGYYASQSIRKSVLDVPAELGVVKRYRILQRELPNTYVAVNNETVETSTETLKPKTKGKKSTKAKGFDQDRPKAAGFIKLPAARGRIADNLVTGQPWYADLSVPQIWDHDEMERQRKKKPGTSIERLWFQAICYQRSKLMKLIAEDDMWDTEAEKVFVHMFWETLDSLYAQEAEAVKRGGSAPLDKRWERLEGELYRALTQAKTRILLRTALSTWIARAGRQKSIRNHPAAVWRLIDHPEHWRKGRDLALVALASYRKKEDREPLNSQSKNPETKS